MSVEEQKESFLRAYDEYAQAIYRHCFFRVFSKAKAEELMQETFMKVWQYISEGKEVQNLRAFLYRVATNLIIDQSRKKKEESLDALMEMPNFYEPGYDGHKDMERITSYKQVLSTLKGLPEDYREVLVLRYVNDLDPREIAKILGTSPNNVSVKINRAINMLKGLNL